MRAKRSILVAAAILAAVQAWALEPGEIAVVYNADFEGSKALAEYYAEKRAVPEGNLVGIHAPKAEFIDRSVYLDTVEKPVREWLEVGERKKKIQCVLLMRGVPLGINWIDDEPKRWARDGAYEALKKAKEDLKKLQDSKSPKAAEIEKRLPALEAEADRALKAFNDAIRDTNASVDSELAVMFWKDHPVQGWLISPLFWRTWTSPGREKFPKTFMTGRLDGPTDAIVRRVIDDSIATEAVGLKGVAYFDAWHKYKGGPDPREGIIETDELIRKAGRIVEAAGLKTVIDDTEQVFQPGTCPHAALYCGWYSLEHYVPAFAWERGAVGYHVASGECMSLRDPKAQYWCKRMLEEGVAATIGPTAEPYVTSFPAPTEFFPFLLTGRYTLAEVYWYTEPYVSWKQVLVGDPLYTPFLKNPHMTIPKMREVVGIPPG